MQFLTRNEALEVLRRGERVQFHFGEKTIEINKDTDFEELRWGLQANLTLTVNDVINGTYSMIEEKESLVSDDKKMLEYAQDLRSDLKYSLENDEEQIIEDKDIKTVEWLIEQAKRAEMYKAALIEIAEEKVSPVFYAKCTLYETDQRFSK